MISPASGALVLPVNSGLSLTEIFESDLPAYVEHFRDREIHDWTLRIPFPYTALDAQDWITCARRERDPQGRPLHFAIRSRDGLLIGGMGFVESRVPGREHQAEIGYWLAKPLWGRGLMTECVRALKAYAFEDLGLEKLIATVFINNVASIRVLEKNGFELEAILRKHYKKDGSHVDGKIYRVFRPFTAPPELL